MSEIKPPSEPSAPLEPGSPGDSGVCEVRVTAPDPEWLLAHSRFLVERRLVACAQHDLGVRSLYWWEGRVEQSEEARAAWHTVAHLVPEVLQQTLAAHPDSVPGILVVPVVGGNPAYLEWVRSEVGGSR